MWIQRWCGLLFLIGLKVMVCTSELNEMFLGGGPGNPYMTYGSPRYWAHPGGYCLSFDDNTTTGLYVYFRKLVFDNPSKAPYMLSTPQSELYKKYCFRFGKYDSETVCLKRGNVSTCQCSKRKTWDPVSQECRPYVGHPCRFYGGKDGMKRENECVQGSVCKRGVRTINPMDPPGEYCLCSKRRKCSSKKVYIPNPDPNGPVPTFPIWTKEQLWYHQDRNRPVNLALSLTPNIFVNLVQVFTYWTIWY